jgi:hypothetical protein
MRFSWRAVLGLWAVLAGPAAAQSNYKFLSGSGVNGLGTQVGIYKAELDNKTIDVFCVDFLNNVSAGDRYRVNKTLLGGSPDLGNTRFGTYSDQPDRYQMAAWLAAQFYQQPTTEWATIHAAIWHLTTPGSPNVSAQQSVKVDNWLAQAQADYSKYYYDNVFILTDVAVANCAIGNAGGAPWTGCGKQEHIYIEGGTLTTTPEPASMALLATGLVALGVAGFFRRRKDETGKTESTEA